MPVCDHCDKSLTHGRGFAFYSTASMAGRTIGNLLLCESCTDGFLNDTEFSKPPPSTSQASDDLDAFLSQIIEGRNPGGNPIASVANAAIIQTARRLGLSPRQAKAKAQELAVQWWSDQQRGALQIMKFWTSRELPKENIPTTQSKPVNAPSMGKLKIEVPLSRPAPPPAEIVARPSSELLKAPPKKPPAAILKVEPAPREPVVAPVKKKWWQFWMPDAQPAPTVPVPPFKFPCPHCGSRLSATPDFYGTEEQCPACRKAFTVPRPAG